MKMLRTTLMTTVLALAAPGVSAQNVIVESLTDTDEFSQLVQFKEVGGDCRFYGAIEHPAGDVHIEVKTCPTEDGSTIAYPIDATVEHVSLPVSLGTRFTFKQE